MVGADDTAAPPAVGPPDGPAVGAFFALDGTLIDGKAAELGSRDEIFSRLFHPAWRRVRAHARRGHTVALVGSATPSRVAPLARELGVEHVLCSGPGSDDPATLVSRFAADHDVDLDAGWAYANDDVELLSTVGNPVAVNPAPALASAADERGWPVLEFDRPTVPAWDLRPWLRTAGLYGTFFLSSAFGIAGAAVNADRRTGIDLATALIGPLGQAAGSIGIEVTGEEHVWSHRPAVFLINHQSAMVDMIVTTRLLRGGITALVKKEVRDTPVIGWLMAQADMAFVDRGGPGAGAVLDEAEKRLRQGISVVVAPEGTRSRTPTVGSFKRGAFRLAAQAGVPIVPVVIRNAGEIMWRDAYSAYPGTVEVHVHPPIPTDGWAAADVAAAAKDVRALYVDTLDAWPGDEA